MRIPARVVGWGRHHPAEVVTNADLEARLDTSDEWIRERTGIRSRRVGGVTTDMAVAAALDAVGHWGGDPAGIDAITVATSTPDRVMPPVASAVAAAIGADAGMFDVNGACTGFVQALVAAHGLLAAGVGRVLVVGADAMSRITDREDRGTTILFGDGAGALVVETAEAGAGGLLSVDFGGDPGSCGILTCAAGGHIEMQGQAVFKVAVRAAIDSARRALDKAGIEASEIDLFVPHQANQRITDAIASRLGLAEHTVVSTIAETANTSAATIPAAISVAADDGRLRDGHRLLLSGFGAGMTWATAVVRWDSGGRTPAAAGPGK